MKTLHTYKKHSLRRTCLFGKTVRKLHPVLATIFLFCLLAFPVLNSIGCISSGDRMEKTPGLRDIKTNFERLTANENSLPSAELAKPGRFTVIAYFSRNTPESAARIRAEGIRTDFTSVYLVEVGDQARGAKNRQIAEGSGEIPLPSLALYGPTGNIRGIYPFTVEGVDSVIIKINKTLELLDYNLGDRNNIDLFHAWSRDPEVIRRDGYYEVNAFGKVFQVNEATNNPSKITIWEFGTPGCVNCKKLERLILDARFNESYVDYYSANLAGEYEWDSLKRSLAYKLWQLDGMMSWPYTYIITPGGMTYVYPGYDPSIVTKIQELCMHYYGHDGRHIRPAIADNRMETAGSAGIKVVPEKGSDYREEVVPDPLPSGTIGEVVLECGYIVVNYTVQKAEGRGKLAVGRCKVSAELQADGKTLFSVEKEGRASDHLQLPLPAQKPENKTAYQVNVTLRDAGDSIIAQKECRYEYKGAFLGLFGKGHFIPLAEAHD